MQENKVYVQKKGSVYTVPVDPVSGIPIKITSASQELPGFPFTFTSENELRGAFPNKEFVFLEDKPANSEHRPLVIDAEIKRKAAEIMSAHKLNPPNPTRTVAVAEATAAPLQGAELGHKQKAEEFLKRLQTALEYASKKHEKKLQAQVEIIDTLIKEIF